jgi:D-alanyl-D-alanine carboxypeptidase
LTTTIALTLVAGCGALSSDEASQELQNKLSAQLADDGARHAVLHVSSPSMGMSESCAAGERAPGSPMTPETPFLSASVGKLFVATATLALAERGELSLDDPITRWLDADVLSGLPLGGGDARFDDVTITHLLGHRSGLPDYFVGATRDGAPNVFEQIVADPDRAWSRQDLLDYTREHFDPAGTPGDQFLYSDLNYDLVGMVLEAATGDPYTQVVRREVIDALGLTHTWYHDAEVAPEGLEPIAHAWLEGTQIVGKAALSADQAGGGLATTADDLEVFMRAVASSRLVDRSALERYTEDAINPGIDYGLGLWRIRPGEVFFLLGDMPELIGVSGALGTYVYYVADHDAVLAGTFDHSDWGERHIEFLLSEVLPILLRIDPEK